MGIVLWGVEENTYYLHLLCVFFSEIWTKCAIELYLNIDMTHSSDIWLIAGASGDRIDARY